MTPIRPINYATWAIWGAVTLVALLNAGWVRISTIEAGGALPMTLEFFVIPDTCYWVELFSMGRYYAEMFMVPANLALIGFALAIPWARFRTATTAYTLLTVYFTIEFAEDPRLLCPVGTVTSHTIHDPGPIWHLIGFTEFDIISLIPRIIYLALFFVTPVTWAPVGRWTRLTRGAPVNAPLTT